VAQALVPTGLTRWGAAPDVATSVADDLVARYGEPHRRYHTLEHIGEVLDVLARLGAEDAVTLAAWFHDAVYDPRAHTGASEHASAVLARDQLGMLGAPASIVDEVARLVELTAGHEPAGGDMTGRALADADLAILGAAPDRYERYRVDVRAEYAHVPDDAWRTGRAAVLRRFLERRRLFHDDALHAELDAKARANLSAELDSLGGGAPAP
jgi:predicted metal-dependent HD superfamily phosphohydrolase